MEMNALNSAPSVYPTLPSYTKKVKATYFTIFKKR